MLRLMVQGDRDAKGIEDAVRKLGTLCQRRGIGLNVGESGQIVRILGETGAHVRVHQTKPERPNVPEGFTGEIVNCWSAVAEPAIDTSQPVRLPCKERLAWGIRLACLDASDGFLFFPGREGTLAHLVPIMAFIAKGERDKGVARPRRVALVGWRREMRNSIGVLFNIPILGLDTGLDVEHTGPELVRSFNCHTICSGPEPRLITEAVAWLTEGLPAK